MADKLLVKTYDVMDLFAGTINKSDDAELSLADYPHLQHELNLLTAYLKQVVCQINSKVSIFSCTAVRGTGKTQALVQAHSRMRDGSTVI